MKPSTLLLAAALALGTGLSGNALAHGDYGRDYRPDRHYYDGDRYKYRRDHRRDARRHWRDHKRWYRKDHRRHRYYDDYRRHRDHGDIWYGLHLFLGGH